MPIEMTVDTSLRLIRARISGDFTMDDILVAISSAVESPDFEVGFNVLSDHREVQEFLTPAQARGMTAHLASLADVMGHAKWAAVVTHPASLGMMRMVAVLAGRIPLTVETFGTEEEALAWLNS